MAGRRQRRVLWALRASTLALVLVFALPATAPAAPGDEWCLTTDPPPATVAPQLLRFGITPQAAGSAGVLQEQPAPVDEAAAIAALEELRPPGKELVLRLNRLFWADGEEGIARFARLVDDYAAQGFRSEVQVRYHPPEGRAGDMEGWEAFVRGAVGELATRPSVVAFSITNEGNLPISPNTSDGAYEGVHEAIVRGVVAAREAADAAGRPDIGLGFSVMWRWFPDSDARFWSEIGRLATPEFRAALDSVGLQVYPGLVWPPVPFPGRTAGQEVVEALTLLRNCYLPKAGLGEDVALWVSENGYATNLGRSEATQERDLADTVAHVHEWSGTLGVTDYRWFNLRDNRSNGTDLFSAVGLLRDDYTRKPAFASFRALVDASGAEAPAAAP